MKKLKDWKDWVIAVTLSAVIAAMIWNVVGIFVPSPGVREINKSRNEAQKALEDFNQKSF